MENAGDISLAWWIWAIIATIGILLVICAILKLHEFDIYPLRNVTKIIRRPWFEKLLLLFCIGGFIQYGATKGTNGTENVNQPRIIPRSEFHFGDSGSLEDDLEDIFVITNLCFTGISPLSNSVYLSIAWPTNMFIEGTTLDFFAKICALTNEWTWLDACSILPNTTNLEVEIAYPVVSGSRVPSAMFFRVQDRATCATTMRDTDLDGIPDVYELNNGTNPYVPDATLVHPLTVGPNGTYASVEAALANSMAYSIISLEGETFVQSKSLVLPSHPVLIEGPNSGYAVIQSDAEIGAIMLTNGQDKQTMFRNLIIDLRAQKNFQAGFWVGGNTPWTGQGAAATFENVRVRANYPGVEHFGWLFYRNDGTSSYLRQCVMNAAGSTWAYGVSSYNAASNIIEDCTFLNMPTNAGESFAIAILTREATNGVIEVRSPEVRPDLSWAGYSYDGSYSQTSDSDGDGLSDHDEIFLTNTDPWLADSDGDGILDGEEVNDETNPQNLNSHGYKINVSVRNADVIPNVTNYVFVGFEDSPWSNMVYSCRESGGATNFTLKIDDGALLVSAFRDLNRNGTFDADHDIVLSNRVSELQAVANIVLKFGDFDGDGVNDLQERLDETDPYSKLSLKISRTVTISNSDSNATITNYYAIAQSQDATDVQWTKVTSNPMTIPVSLNTVSGCLYALVYRDLNGNGIYEEGVDTLYNKNRFVSGSTEFIVSVGDADRDTISDSREMQEGTNPLDPKSYCYQVAARITGVFATTNQLTCNAKFGTNEILTATIVTNSEFAVALGHHSTTNGEIVTLWFWDDANSNSVRDVDETCTSIEIKPNGHEVTYEGTLSTLAFDKDRNGLMDWWEIFYGLNDIGMDGNWDSDPDHDGLINLHEYWSECNPCVPDGSNTIFFLLSQSIDSRLSSEPMGRITLFDDSYPNRLHFNTNCWAFGIDLTCASPYNSKGGCREAGTAITDQHIVLANHFYYPAGTRVYFMGSDGQTIERQVIAGSRVASSDIYICLLDTALPETVHPAKILPSNFADYIGNGRGLPLLMLDQEEHAIVADLSNTFGNIRPSNQLRQLYYESIISGDSGNPVFLVLGNTPILLYTFFTAGGGPSLSQYANEIQTVMNNLSLQNGQALKSLSFVDFSQFEKIQRKLK